jgi:thiamine biosynthesis lipoprotein
MAPAEIIESFDCFGSSCAAFVTGPGRQGSALEAAEHVRRTLLGWHERFSRFLSDSELSRMNADPRTEVPVSEMMARLANAVTLAGYMSRGLVDATLIDQIESAGYVEELGRALPLQTALRIAPPRRAAAADPSERWRLIEANLTRNTVTRPPGIKLDSGGLAKGLFADALAEDLAGHASFAINCAGDLVIGGAAGVKRSIEVESPFDGRTLHTFNLRQTGVATSGIGRRAWLDSRGRPCHHLLDPCTGRPAFTGIVQVTALAPTALMAEVHAKAAILSGPRTVRAWLPHGGVIVFDDGRHEVVEPPPVVTLSQLRAHAEAAPAEVARHG